VLQRRFRRFPAESTRGHLVPGSSIEQPPAGFRGRSAPLPVDCNHTVPWAIANASFKRQQDNPGVTEIVEMKDRGHALTIDSGWREVADTALVFANRFV